MSLKRFLLYCMAFLLVFACLFAQHAQKGKATYYSDKLHGRKMSSGEKYHRDSMVCAHLTYPFGTLLRVKNLNNGKEVTVRVADRGPFVKRYTIDLSMAAARQLGFVSQGVCTVEITPVGKMVHVPFKAEGEEELPRLYLHYEDIVINSVPLWQQKEELLQKRPQHTVVLPLETESE